jgi:hypothetical protein
MMPFVVAAAWAILTCFFWLIAASLASSASCVTFDGITFDDGSSEYWFGDVGKWQAVQAFAWLLFFSFLALPFCFYWHVVRRNDAGWRDGIYGKSFMWKDSSSKQGIGHTAAPAPAPTMTQAV